MKIKSANIYALKIPFIELFRHNLSERNYSDSIIVELIGENGISGYGEGVARPYVTGETQASSIEYIRTKLIPCLNNIDLLSPAHTKKFLLQINDIFKKHSFLNNGIVYNAARCAVELALIDCLLKNENISMSSILPPKIEEVTYSAVISAGNKEKVAKLAHYCNTNGFKFIKIKVTGMQDLEKMAILRNIVGADVSIRIDANAAFDLKTAQRFIASVEKYNIASIEQPIPRNQINELVILKNSSPIPIMADESLVTIKDAKELISRNAVDYFNIRISKCGGLYNSLKIAKLAHSAGIGIQVGCQVGETSILSAAGRHLAAYLCDSSATQVKRQEFTTKTQAIGVLCRANPKFIEGSYSKQLLIEDITKEVIGFEYAGRAPLINGSGLGVNINKNLLNKYHNPQAYSKI